MSPGRPAGPSPKAWRNNLDFFEGNGYDPIICIIYIYVYIYTVYIYVYIYILYINIDQEKKGPLRMYVLCNTV